MVAFILAMRTLIFSHADSPTRSTAGSEATVARPSAPKSVVTEHPPLPTWTGRRQATWARDGSRTIAFELPATDDVPVWMSRVRPLLVVRCLYRTTEVFVATGSAASVEAQSDRHTVRVQIDGGPEEVQQWSTSVSQQELFAPDGIAWAKRLARAHRLRFGFTPYNARPVTAEFAVQGFDQLMGLVARTCGWRADEAAASTVAVSRAAASRTGR